MTLAANSIDTLANEDAAELASARRNRVLGVATPVLTAVLLIVLWEVGVTLFGVPSYIAPTPSAVAATLVGEFPQLMKNFWPTFYESVLGFIVGNTAAVLIAIVFVHSRLAEQAFFPIAVFINTIPILAIAPILVLIFGAGLTAKVVIAALICFFPTLVNMVRGLQSVSPQALELARILSASKAEIFWKIRLPSSLPFLFSALKIAATTCVIGAIVGEWVGASAGIGFVMLQSNARMQTDTVFACLILLGLSAITLRLLVENLSRRLAPWMPES